MRTQTVDTFLRTLAARVPAPGGGATAQTDEILLRADKITAAVREQILR